MVGKMVVLMMRVDQITIAHVMTRYFFSKKLYVSITGITILSVKRRRVISARIDRLKRVLAELFLLIVNLEAT